MPAQVSGKRYAQAIFELAREQDELDQWAEDLQLVGQALQDEDFEAFLKHAEVPAADKVRAISTVLSTVHPLVQNLVQILVARRQRVLLELGIRAQQSFEVPSFFHSPMVQ